MDYRIVEAGDLPLLAGMNRALIEDEGAANRMSLAELEARMRGWLAGEYRAVLFEIEGAAIGYALFRPEEDGVHLRQLFIDRARRRQGLGREAVRRLHTELWPAGARISVEVLVGNARGLAFWRAVGFADHAITLTSTPKLMSEGDSEHELAEFVELLEEAGAWLWERGIRQWEPGSNRRQLARLRALLRDGRLVVARAEGRLAGGCILSPEPTEEWARRPAAGFYLYKLAVARAFAGRALGAAILAQAEDEARRAGVERLRLDCWDGNDRLRAYYRAAGYRELDAVSSHGYQVRLFEKELGPA